MAPPTGFERAALEIDGENEPIKCWFNPKEYSVSKSNEWKCDPVTGNALPPLQFGGGQPRELSLELLFDASDSDSLDVSKTTDRLLKMMEVGGESGSSGGRPPFVTFRWGKSGTFKAAVTQLNIQYTLFRSNGKPIRATAKLNLKQAEKAQDPSAKPGGTRGGRNPTTQGLPALRSHLLRDGDTLQSIAYSVYGDATEWRLIAEENGIDDPLRLRRGTTLAIPRSS
jgi:Contractile injection system tube protein/LysM domain